MFLKRRTILILTMLCFLGAALDLHNMRAADKVDVEHDKAILVLRDSVDTLKNTVAAQKVRIDNLQLLVEDQLDRAEDQSDQLVDVDKRLRTFERNEEKVCEEKW